MGTNYYIRTSEEELIHLGKSSMGWKFGFYASPFWPRDKAYALWCAQVDVHLLNGGRIEDEYGVSITKDELMKFIASKQGHHSHLTPRPDERAAWEKRGDVALYDRLLETYFDCDGYDFCDAEFS